MPARPSITSCGLDTKTALIRAATRLIAERGFEAVSTREITKEAGVNVASVNYHFGSREELLDAVMVCHCRPINKKRLNRLGVLTAQAEAGQTVSLKDWLRAMFEPMVEEMMSGEFEQKLFARMLGRLMGEKGYSVPEEALVEFRQVASLLIPGIQRVLPDLDGPGVMWKIHFCFGAVSHTFLHGDLLGQICPETPKNRGPEELLEELIDFCAAGMKGSADVAN